MNKQEALAVLHEIHNAWKGKKSERCVSSDGSQVSHIMTGGYEIKMKCNLDSTSRDILMGILKKYGLYMKEQAGYVILRSHKN